MYLCVSPRFSRVRVQMSLFSLKYLEPEHQSRFKPSEMHMLMVSSYSNLMLILKLMF